MKQKIPSVDPTPAIQTIPIIRVARDSSLVHTEDRVANETVLTIYVNDIPAGTLLCSPLELEDLVTGFLVSEGLVSQGGKIRAISIDSRGGRAAVTADTDMELLNAIDGKRTITSGCGASGSEIYRLRDSLRARPIDSMQRQDLQDILHGVRVMGDRSELFRETGGVHSCGIVRGATVLHFADDVGRHNAADKVLGALARRADITDERSRRDLALVTTGRLSSEMVLKTAIHRIPVLASRSAPTRLAISIARELNLTVLGFCRGKSCNIYCGEERVLDSEAPLST